jgi:predicted O-methyltransferase YrrM
MGTTHTFPLVLLASPKGEVKDVCGVPASERRQVGHDVVRSEQDDDLRIRAVRRFRMGSIRARGIVERSSSREANGHPFRKGFHVPGPRQKMTRKRPHDTERLGDGGERLLERAAARHPEFVGIRVDHPGRSEVSRRVPCHAAAPDALAHVPTLPKKPEHAPALVGLEDLRRSIARVVIGREHEIHACIQMVGDLRVDDVRLIADDQRLHQLHGRQKVQAAGGPATAERAVQFRGMTATSKQLEAENERLRDELSRARARLSAFEKSRWHRIHPGAVWRRIAGSARVRATGRPSGAGIVTAAETGAAIDSRISQFVEDVVGKGRFSHRWAVGDMPRWEPLFRVLEQQESAEVLEIGSFEGLSTCYFLWRLPLARVTSIDTFAGSEEHQTQSVDTSSLEEIFEANVALVDRARVRKVMGDSKRRLLDLAEEGALFDLVYVDGSHLGLDVLVDAALSWSLLAEGGVLVFDDYPWAKLGDDPLLRPGPAVDAFLQLIANRYELLFTDYQLALRKLR